jgi:hypothetical protein
MVSTEIRWSSLRDRHLEGDSCRGRVWIRLNRQEQVTGIYTQFGAMEKWVPDPEETLTLEDGKIQAEILLSCYLAAEKLSEK